MVRRLIVVTLAFVLILSGCERKDSVIPTLAEPIGINIDTAVVSRGDIYDLETYDAKVYPDIQEVCSAIDGSIKDIAVYLGQEVKEGDLLINLNDEEKKEELKKRKEELDATQRNNAYEIEKQDLDLQVLELNILQKKQEEAPLVEIAKLEADFVKQRLIQEQTIELQEFYSEKTKRKIEDLEQELKDYKITAPCSGSIVYMKQINLNSRINSLDTVIIIADDTKLHVQSSYISKGVIASASQIYALINGEQYDIEYIPLKTDEILKMKNSGLKLETKYSFQADKNIASGDYVCVCIIEKLKKDVLMIPNNALYSDAEGDFVYRVIDDEQVRCNVELGTKTKIQVEIINGLAEGDVVYVQK